MTGLHCCASHGGKLFQSTKGLATNSGSPWILQAPNLHFRDAVVNTCDSFFFCSVHKMPNQSWQLIFFFSEKWMLKQTFLAYFTIQLAMFN